MSKISSILVLLFFSALFEMPTAQAQTNFAIGARGGYDFGDFEDPMIGAELRIGLGTIPLQISPAIDYYFVADRFRDEDATLLQIDINALYPFGLENQSFTPYAGVGLGISRYSIDFDETLTDTGLNLIGGATFGFGSIRPYAQARIKLGDPELLTLMGGLFFQLGQLDSGQSFLPGF